MDDLQPAEPTTFDVVVEGQPNDDASLVRRYCDTYGHARGPYDLDHHWRLCTRDHGMLGGRCPVVLTDESLEGGQMGDLAGGSDG